MAAGLGQVRLAAERMVSGSQNSMEGDVLHSMEVTLEREVQGPRLTVQGRLQGAYAPHPPEAPHVSGGWHVELGDLWDHSLCLMLPVC